MDTERSGITLAALLVTGLILLSLVAAVWFALSFNRFQLEGELTIAGLRESVEVYRDGSGVPHIVAGNPHDLLFAQGFVTAQHRLFQVEFYRRLMEGRLAELVGERALSSDIRMRTLDLRRNARRHAERLNADTRRRLSAYARGYSAYVRDFVHEHPLELQFLGLEPRTLEVEDVVLILHYMAYAQSRTYPGEVLLADVVDRIGPERSGLLFPMAEKTNVPAAAGFHDTAASPPGLPAMGSNAWAVSGARTASELPILASDPHLDARVLPGIWHPVGLYAPGVEAVGAAMPGLPGLLVGRNRHVAFGITNSYADVQDLYREMVDPENPARYLEGERSRPFQRRVHRIQVRDPAAEDGVREERIVSRRTRRGPVIEAAPLAAPPVDQGFAYSLRWSAAEPAAWGPAIGVDRLFLAENVEALDEAVREISIPILNVVFAGADGRIGFRATGRVPVRADNQGILPRPVGGTDDWVDWVAPKAMPGGLDPEEGWVASANNNLLPEDFPHYYSNMFGAPFRYHRIAELLGQAEASTAKDHWHWMQDLHNPQARALRPVILSAMDRLLEAEVDIPSLADARSVLADWDLRDAADQPAPLLYQAIYRELAYRSLAEVLGGPLALRILRVSNFWQEPLQELWLSDRLDDWLAEGDSGIDGDRLVESVVETVLEELVADHGPDPAAWRWGDAHTIRFTSPLAEVAPLGQWFGGGTYPHPGSGDTLLRGGYSFVQPFEARLHDSLRLVADFSEPERIMAVVAGGVVGRQFDGHFADQLEIWRRGKVHYWPFGVEAVREQSRRSVQLVPAARD